MNEAPGEEEGDDETPAPEERDGIYRKEASDAAREPRREKGDVLRIAPTWLTASYWVVVTLLITVVTLAAFARVNEYARGPAIISASTRTVVSAASAGLVAEVLVAPGQLVKEGDVLVRLNDAQEAAELAQLDAEFDQQLARTLLDRGNTGARESLVGLRGLRDAARARLASRQVRAPRSGRVSDARARPGQYVQAGAPVVSLLESDPHFRVIALLPGSARPQVQPGMALRLELGGYAYAYQTVRVIDVSPQVIGPGEARRFLGPDVADAIVVDGPVTLLTAELEGSSFVVDGRTLEYHDGMPAIAEVPVRQVRLAVLLAPWLRRIF